MVVSASVGKPFPFVSDLWLAGATSVLQACVSTPSVKRAVLTSSCASIAYGHEGGMGSKVWTPADWTNPDAPTVGAYVESKTRAEQAGEAERLPEFSWRVRRGVHDTARCVAPCNDSRCFGGVLESAPTTQPGT